MRPVPFMDLAALHGEIASEMDQIWAETVAESAFIGGGRVERFEHEFAAFCGRTHAIGVGNGTDALELVLRALGIGAGDEVVVPANTFFATAEAVHLAGATPVFVDVEPDTLLMSPAAAEAALTSRSAAIIAVHLFGQTVDLDGFAALARRTGLPLIEDAAQAHGARWQQRTAGSVGTAGCFSFYPGKNLGALGDAGAVVTNDPQLAERVRSMANHGRDETSPSGHRFVGRNSRLDALQAGILGVKLAHLDRWNDRRRQLWSIYREGFAGSSVLPVSVDPRAASVHHLAVVRVAERDRVRRRLAEFGVATGVHYPVPCHRLPPLEPDQHDPLPVAEQAAAEIVSLPMYPHLTDDQARYVVHRVLDAVDPALAAADHG